MVSGSKNKKSKMVLAKDAKQLKLAAIVVLLFLGSTVYTIVKSYNDANPQPAAPSSVSKPAGPLDAEAGSPMTSGTQADPTTQGLAQDANNIYNQTVGGQQNKTQIEVNAPTEPANDEVEIIARPKTRGKMVTITVSNSGRSNPFLPANENFHVPRNTFAFLTPPPETLPTSNDAVKLINTTISGILYDPYSPSAIINIDGSDYLVKRGDVINHYKVLSISKTQVMVQLGRNIYKAGVGELLSQTDLNSSVANLNRKFGGNSVQINVKRKKI